MSHNVIKTGVYVNGVEHQGELCITTEVIDITASTRSEPDPNWTYTDAEGHFHACDVNGKYPTLEYVETEGEWCDTCNERHGTTLLVCKLCLDEVTPGTRWASTGRKMRNGPTSWRVNVMGVNFRVGEKVSIRVGQETGPTLFGIAEVVNTELQLGELTIADLVGIGELGRTDAKVTT